jgi:hypothetical protein
VTRDADDSYHRRRSHHHLSEGSPAAASPCQFAEFEALISILTGDILEGSMPEAKLRQVQSWLAANREQIAYVWREIHALRYDGGRIDQ